MNSEGGESCGTRRAHSPAFPLRSWLHASGSSGPGPPLHPPPPSTLLHAWAPSHRSPGHSIPGVGVLGAVDAGCALTMRGGTAANPRMAWESANASTNLCKPQWFHQPPQGKKNRRNRAGDNLPLNPSGVEGASHAPPGGQQPALGAALVGSAGCWQHQVLLDLNQMTRGIRTF